MKGSFILWYVYSMCVSMHLYYWLHFHKYSDAVSVTYTNAQVQMKHYLSGHITVF
jgi:hypothetical protein